MTNTSLIETIYSAFGRGDAAAVAACCSADTRWDFAVARSAVPWHTPVVGRAGVSEFLGAFVENVELHQFRPAAFVASGDDVLAHIELAYTVRRTGKRVEMDQLHWWKVRDGKVVRLRHYEDTAQVLAAWG